MIFFRKAKRIAELETENEELRTEVLRLTTDLRQQETFVSIGDRKLEDWVAKYYDLLAQFKSLQQTFL